MPALLRPRSATARLSWSSSRPASARHLPPGRTTLSELDKLLLEAEQDAHRPPPPPKVLTDAEEMERQRSEWIAKDEAFIQAANERQREEQRIRSEEQRIRSEEQQQEERAKMEAAVDAEHDKAVQARLRRLGLAGNGKAKARLRQAIQKMNDVDDDGEPLTKAQTQRRDTLKVLSSFHTGTYDEIEQQVDRNFDAPNHTDTSASRPPRGSAGLVTDSDFELGLAYAKDGVGDKVHADMFCKLHAIWFSACGTTPNDESKEENDQVRAMVVARFLRYQRTWPKTEDDPETIAFVQYMAGNSGNISSKDTARRRRKKNRPSSAPAGQRISENDLHAKVKRQAGKCRRPQSGPARQGAEKQRNQRRSTKHPTPGDRPASGPPRIGWSAEADAYIARLGLVPPLGRPPSAQPIRSGDQWAQRPHHQQQPRPVSAPARLAATVVAKWSHYSLGYALRGWRDAANWRAAARERLRYCVNRLIDDRLHRCIDRWRAQVSLQKRAKQLLRRTVATWNNQNLVHAFNAWKGFLVAEANKYGRILAMWKGDGRRTYFNLWKDAIVLIKEARPASHGFFQGLGLTTLRGIETAPKVWKVGQIALQSDSDDMNSSDSGSDEEVETQHTHNLQKERKALQKRKRRAAAEHSEPEREQLCRSGHRGLNKRLMRYYDGCSNVKRTDNMCDKQSATATADDPLAWTQLEISAMRTRPRRVPTTQALTRKPSPEPSSYDIVTAALEGRLRNRDSHGTSLGYLGPVAAQRDVPREANVYDEDQPSEAALSEKPEPELEVQARANELYSQTDQLGQLHFEGRWISHAYRRSALRVDKRRGAVSNVTDAELRVGSSCSREQDPRKLGRHKKCGANGEGGATRARSARLVGGLSQALGLMQSHEGGSRLPEAAAAGWGLGSNSLAESSKDAAAAAAAAVAAMAAELHSGVSTEQATAAVAREQRLALERERGWQIEAEKLGDTRLISSRHRGKRRQRVSVDKKQRPSLWHSARAVTTSACVIC